MMRNNDNDTLDLFKFRINNAQKNSQSKDTLNTLYELSIAYACFKTLYESGDNEAKEFLNGFSGLERGRSTASKAFYDAISSLKKVSKTSQIDKLKVSIDNQIEKLRAEQVEEKIEETKLPTNILSYFDWERQNEMQNKESDTMPTFAPQPRNTVHDFFQNHFTFTSSNPHDNEESKEEAQAPQFNSAALRKFIVQNWLKVPFGEKLDELNGLLQGITPDVAEKITSDFGKVVGENVQKAAYLDYIMQFALGGPSMHLQFRSDSDSDSDDLPSAEFNNIPMFAPQQRNTAEDSKEEVQVPQFNSSALKKFIVQNWLKVPLCEKLDELNTLLQGITPDVAEKITSDFGKVVGENVQKAAYLDYIMQFANGELESHSQSGDLLPEDFGILSVNTRTEDISLSGNGSHEDSDI